MFFYILKKNDGRVFPSDIHMDETNDHEIEEAIRKSMNEWTDGCDDHGDGRERICPFCLKRIVSGVRNEEKMADDDEERIQFKKQ